MQNMNDVKIKQIYKKYTKVEKKSEKKHYYRKYM